MAALECGANANAANSVGTTALHMFASVGDLRACRTLIEEFGAECQATNNFHGTPLHLASSIEVMDLLLRSGADVNAGASANRSTPLHAHAKGGRDPKVFELLLAAGAYPDAVNQDGLSCLHAAAQYGNDFAFLVLVAAGADQSLAPSLITWIGKKGPATALQWGARCGCTQFCETVIRAGADTTGLLGYALATPEAHGMVEQLRAVITEAAMSARLLGGATHEQVACASAPRRRPGV